MELGTAQTVDIVPTMSTVCPTWAFGIEFHESGEFLFSFSTRLQIYSNSYSTYSTVLLKYFEVQYSVNGAPGL